MKRDLRDWLIICGVTFALVLLIAWKAEALTASYNPHIHGMVVAAPPRYKVGSHLRVCRHKCIVVTVLPGGCACFDLSATAFAKLAPISDGLVKVTVTRV